MRVGQWMGRGFVVAVSAAVMSLASTVASPSVAGAEQSGGTLPACVSVRTEARYVPYGYNHVVVLKNGCSKAATCSVATDVNPQSSSVDVASSATVEVLTFSASPAQAFTARVTCTLR